MSALLTTTMPYMKVVIDELKNRGLRDNQEPYELASLMGIFFSSAIRLGITGIISPQPITSMRSVMKIKLTAAFLETFITQ